MTLIRFRTDDVHEEPAVTLEAFLGQSNATAVRLEAGDDARALLPYLDRIALVNQTGGGQRALPASPPRPPVGGSARSPV